MKKCLSIFLTAALLSVAVVAHSQTAPPFDEATLVNVQTYARVSEVKHIVTLTLEQEQAYTDSCKLHYAVMYRAVHKEPDPDKAAQMMREAQRAFDRALMNVLTAQQQVQYIRTMMKDDIHQETMVKVTILQKSGKYTKEELDKFYEVIYDYYMTVKISNTRNQYDIAKRKENVSQLKKIAPKIIKEANARSKDTYKGKSMGKNDKWN